MLYTSTLVIHLLDPIQVHLRITILSLLLLQNQQNYFLEKNENKEKTTIVRKKKQIKG